MSDIGYGLDTAGLAYFCEDAGISSQFEVGRMLTERLQLLPGERVLDGGSGALDELENSSFDVVYLAAAFHWLPENPEPLRQFHRVLVAGGRLGISTPASERLGTLHALRKAVLARSPYARFSEPRRGGAQRVTMVQLQDLLLRTGFAVSSLEIVPNITVQPSPSAAVEFAEASSAESFFGHLPEELRARAREELERELDAFRVPEGIWLEEARIVAVAHRINH